MRDAPLRILPAGFDLLKVGKGFSALRLAIVDAEFPFQLQHIVPDVFGGAAGMDDLVRILFQRLDPVLDIGGVLPRIMADADVFSQHPRGDLRPEFFPGIRLGAARAELPIQAGGMARPVPQLMQRRGIVFVAGIETGARRQMDLVRGRAVKGPVRLVMLDDRAGSFQQGFRPLLRLPFIAFRRQLQRRQAVNL